MRTTTLPATLLTVFAFTVTGGQLGHAQDTAVDFELGYQWVDVNGNEDMYRTQVNEDDGFVLRNLSVTTYGEGLFELLQLDANGFGGTPNGRFRLRTSNQSYRLNLGYQRFEAYSALPEYANPFLDDGILPGQHTWDRTRQTLDFELEFMPGQTFSPLVGYRWNTYDGDRRTTRHVGQDEFELASSPEETEQELYVGLRFAAGSFSGAVIQGWRDFEGTDRLTLLPGASGGNNSRPVLGQDVELDGYQREIRTEADTPVTTALLNGRLGDRVRLKATFAYADAEADSRDSELLSGSLVSFTLRRYFEGLDESVESRTDSPSWRGDVALGIDLLENLSVDLGYEVRDREVQGWALIQTLYLDTLNFAGTDPDDVTQLVEASTRLERTDSVASIRVAARDLGPFGLWAEYALADQEVEVWQDPVEIVVPGSQEGRFDRQVDEYGVGLTFELGTFDASLDWRSEDADSAVVRTDVVNRDRYRLRLGWELTTILRIVATAEQVEADNPADGIQLNVETDHYAVQLLLTPVKDLTFNLGYDSYQTDTATVIRRPHDFGVEPSLYSEEGEALFGGLTWKLGRFGLEAGYSSYENQGSFPFELERVFGRLAFDLTDSFALAGEVETHEYSESLFAPADFDADRYGLFLRFRL